MLPRPLPAIASTLAVFLGGTVILSTHALGALSAHMAKHILIMNVVAPLIAITFASRAFHPSARFLWIVSLLQLGLLVAWHAPTTLALDAESPTASLGMTAMLVLAASAFWLLVLKTALQSPWLAIAALMLTGKLACLLGALLVFSPRLIFPAVVHGTHGIDTTGLEDQQLAGLLMVSVCPLSYVVAGVTIAAQAISRLGDGAIERHTSDQLLQRT
jgi:putative membrane protein